MTTEDISWSPATADPLFTAMHYQVNPRPNLFVALSCAAIADGLTFFGDTLTSVARAAATPTDWLAAQFEARAVRGQHRQGSRVW